MESKRKFYSFNSEKGKHKNQDTDNRRLGKLKNDRWKVHSLKGKMIALFIGLILFAMLLISILNSFFLGPFYTSHKKGKILDAYIELNQIEDITNEFPNSMQQLVLKDNLSITVTSPNFVVLNSTSRMGGNHAGRLLGYYTGWAKEPVDILEQTNTYVIQQAEDMMAHMKYLEMWGELDNGNYFIIRTPIESIQQTVGLTNIFLLIVGMVVMAAAGIIVLIFARKITMPITELTEISKRMADLDFEAEYDGASNDEIGILGENFNRMSKELEHTISELKTANNELQKDIERKTQIDEMRKEFLNNVSHELKTPIALIQGYAEGLIDNINEDEESRQFYCEVIQDEAMKMNRMVQNLLTLNQLEFGKDYVVMERFDLAALIRGVLQSSDILIRQKGAKVLFDDSTPVFVWGDEYKIEEVFTNYLTNALNHLKHENVIEIRVIEVDGVVWTSVFNTGDPIPENDISHIWTKFYKVDKARTREYGGSGIGLSIVKAIMESMNQKYGVKNYENGVSFWFTLESAESRQH